MGDGGRIKITSSSSSMLETSVTVGPSKYLVITEHTGGGNVITRAYLGGELVSASESVYQKESGRKFQEHMQEQHDRAIGLLEKKEEAPAAAQKEKENNYLKEALALLKKKQGRQALDILAEGVVRCPDDALILSYYGCLRARLGAGRKEGISDCQKAIGHMERLPFGAEFFLPVLYLNLGRAYLSAQKKKEAVAAFEKGLAADPENRELRLEMKRMGERKKPVLPILDRSNPVNRYAGKLRHALHKKSQENR